MSKQIIVLYYDRDIANGGFYDNFEYYYILRRHFGDNVSLIYSTNHSEENCRKQLNDKYENIENDIWDGIKFISHKVGKLYSKKRVDIVFSAISASLYWFIKDKNILVADTYMGLCDTHHIVEPSTYYNQLKLLYDERVFPPEGRYKPYRKKILFDKYRKKEFGGKHNYMINLALAERRYSQEFMINLISEIPKDETIAVYIDNKNKDYYSWLINLDRITVYDPPIKDFMDLFKTFIYIPYTDGHDSTPRLIPECKFYGKDVIMKTDGFKISGGHHRYNDTQNNFESLWLKENDEIINIVEGVLDDI